MSRDGFWVINTAAVNSHDEEVFGQSGRAGVPRSVSRELSTYWSITLLNSFIKRCETCKCISCKDYDLAILEYVNNSLIDEGSARHGEFIATYSN